MKRVVLFFVIAALLLSSLSFSIYADGAVPQEVLESVDSVVRIIAEYDDGYATGSGFVIQSDSSATLIATNHHVVDDNPRSVSIWTESGIKVAVTVFADDPERDLCILQLPYPNAALKALVLDQAGVKRGDAVYAVGFPGAADILTLSEAYSSEAATITNGIISAVRTTYVTEGGKEISLLQSTAPINHGNSGGPLFNSMGYVVGVNTFSVEDSAGIYGAIGIGELIELAESKGALVQFPKESDGFSPLLIIGIAAVVIIAFACILFVLKHRRGKKEKETAQNQIEIESGASNVEEVENDTIKAIKEDKVPKKRAQIKPKHIIIPAAVLLIVCIAVTGFVYYSKYKKAVQLADKGDFSKAADSMILPFITEIHDPSFIGYLNAGKLLEDGNFEEAKKAFTELGSYKNSLAYTLESEYRTGIEFLNRGDYETANEIFIGLSEAGFYVPEDVNLRIKVANAEQLIKEKEFSESYNILAPLADNPSAKQAYEDCLILWASDYFEKRDFLNALKVLEKGKSNSNIQAEISEIKGVIYQEAISFYRSDSEDKQFKAFLMFYAIFPYERSNAYITLLKEKNLLFDWDEKTNLNRNLAESFEKDGFTNAPATEWQHYKRKMVGIWKFYEKCKESGIKMVGDNPTSEAQYWPAVVKYQFERREEVDAITHKYSDLIDLLSFEDASDLLQKNDVFLKKYLEGNWHSSDNGYYFSMKSDGKTNYNLPWFNYGEYYRIENGEYLLYYEKEPDDTRALFSFDIIDKNTMTVFCYKDGSEYRLVRQ